MDTKTPFIENCGIQKLRMGYHTPAGDSGVLIQVRYPFGTYPVAHDKFRKIYQFEFYAHGDGPKWPDHSRIREDISDEIAFALDEAYKTGSSVIVQCPVGYNIAGSIAQAAHDTMGFNIQERPRHTVPRIMRFMTESIKKLGYPKL